jgi:maltooligosyltrehalose trehalohydrolase
MFPEDGGWWGVNAPLVVHGTDYRFEIDGQGPFPDPRSAWQPRGVHGPSRRVDHDLFTWSDKHFQQVPLGSALVYELHVGTFSPRGTFEGVVDRLDYLTALGVTHVELMPIAEFSGCRGWGYDGVDLFAPHHAYGGPDGFKRLVDACHRRHLGVILDVVYNHFGPEGNYLARFGPYFTEKYATPWGKGINFDGPESHEVRRFFIDNALMWLRDYHVDGLRIDVVHAFWDGSAVHVLEELSRKVARLENRLARHLVLIAESDLNDPRILGSPRTGGYGLDAQWNEDFHHALHALLTGESGGYYLDFGSIRDLAKTLTRGVVYDGRYSRYRKRVHGRGFSNIPGDRLVGFLQNHDQVGNRARGERIGHLVCLDRLKMAAALILTAPFVPMLFQGEEWAASTPFCYFTDHGDEDLGRAVREGRQREFAAFGWEPSMIPDPQARSTFEHCVLDWSESRRSPHLEMARWYDSLIRLRRKYSDLVCAPLERVRVVFSEDRGVLTMQRESILTVCNFSLQSRTVVCQICQDATLLLGSKKGIVADGTGVTLPALSVAVLEGGIPDEPDWRLGM